MSVAENLSRVRAEIRAAAERAGRDPGEIELVAVSKRQSLEAIRQAYAAGQRRFGENYVQELLDKAEALADLPELRWHFIGHLQRNKVRQLVGWIAMLETIDSSRLLAEVDKRARQRQLVVESLIQVKIGEEESKSGCAPEELGQLLEAAEQSGGVQVRGLMVIPPYEPDPERSRGAFRRLRQLRDEQGGAARLPRLSMGMSHDFAVAIEEGATSVRIGTAIFGARER